MQRNLFLLNCASFASSLKALVLEKLFDIILQNRKILYKFLMEMPNEKLLEIPEGYRNNIWWNIAHVVVTQQVLVYKLSGLPTRIPADFVEKFRTGTVPDGIATDEEIEIIKGFLFSTVEAAREDYENALFKDFNPYTTSIGITLNNVEDALAFNVYHEGLHLGAIIALKKQLRN